MLKVLPSFIALSASYARMLDKIISEEILSRCNAIRLEDEIVALLRTLFRILGEQGMKIRYGSRDGPRHGLPR